MRMAYCSFVKPGQTPHASSRSLTEAGEMAACAATSRNPVER